MYRQSERSNRADSGALMRRLLIPVILLAASTLGQNCVKYGATTTLSGTLLMRDEAGYNQYTALRLPQPICIAADPKDVHDTTDPYYRTRSGVIEVQANVYGGDETAPAFLRGRMKKLIGYRVVVKGDLFPRTTGYDRTEIGLRVEAVDPADPAGRQALLRPEPEVKVSDVDAYDLSINAGERLVIEAFQSGSKLPLLPSDQYVTHWMTSLEVVYIDCRPSYERSFISTTAKDGGTCFNNDLCALFAFPKKPVMLNLRCTKMH
jgi:hypothetical protein